MVYRDSGMLADELLPERLTSRSQVRLMLVIDSPLDCEMLHQHFSSHHQFDVVRAISDVQYGLACCPRLKPDVLVLSGSAGCEAIDEATKLVEHKQIEHLLLLDDRPRECAIYYALRTPRVSYFTRQSPVKELVAGILKIAHQGQRAFDPLVAERVRRTPHGFRLDGPNDHKSVALLTRREQQVMRLLAQGKSVRDCAEHLQLAESTVDNHKSRLMKKLQVHKASQLTCLAIRDGLIRV